MYVIFSGFHVDVASGAEAQGMSPISGGSKTCGLARLPLGKCTGLLQDPSGWHVDMAVNVSPAVVRQEEHLDEEEVFVVFGNDVTYEV